MLGRTNTGGGGGLNFKVVGGTTAPSNPKENMIWVNTSTKITSYIFSAEEPTNPTPGMVWISTGTSSTVEFDALKKNGIQVYPISAKQYVGGAWVNKTTQIYQGGKWIDLIKCLYNYGDECADVTGGWIAVQPQSSYPKDTTTKNADNLYLASNWNGTSGTSAGWTFQNPVNVTAHKTLKVLATIVGSNYNRICLYAGTSYADTSIASIDNSVGENIEISLDISNVSGEYKVCIGAWGGSDITIHKVWLE